MRQDQHNSYGIQQWLTSKGYCVFKGSRYKIDREKYLELLKNFCLEDNPLFDFSKAKHISNFESYVQNRFTKFCNYVIRIQSTKLPE